MSCQSTLPRHAWDRRADLSQGKNPTQKCKFSTNARQSLIKSGRTEKELMEGVIMGHTTADVRIINTAICNSDSNFFSLLKR